MVAIFSHIYKINKKENQENKIDTLRTEAGTTMTERREREKWKK